ncbi:unnamed protein product [Brassica oleracea]
MFNCSGNSSPLIPWNPCSWNLLLYMAQNSDFFLPSWYTIFCIVTRKMFYLISFHLPVSCNESLQEDAITNAQVDSRRKIKAMPTIPECWSTVKYMEISVFVGEDEIYMLLDPTGELPDNSKVHLFSISPLYTSTGFTQLHFSTMAIVSSIMSTSVDLSSSGVCVFPNTSKIFGNNANQLPTYLRLSTSSRRHAKLRLAASISKVPLKLTREEKHQDHVASPEKGHDVFEEIKHRFLTFKKDKYMDNLERFQSLAKSQSPKFMVIACADSRVCPSEILGFQPGEAFTVRNIANIVPTYESGPSETKAALEFAVNSLQVENILVVGHSRCGGIRALMTMDDDETEEDIDSRSFIKNWVVIGKPAKSISKSAASELSFDQQCQHCEKESVNCSLRNLLSYPWIEERVKKGILTIHGGYYDFTECTFEKWTVDYKERSCGERKLTVKDRSIWN